MQIGIDDQEIQRQNRITAQIVASYLERRLFPLKRPSNRLPTVDEILPPTLTQQQLNQQNAFNHENTSESKSKITRHLQHGKNTELNDDIDDIDEDYTNDDTSTEQDQEPENLQSVESTHVDSYYREMNESNEGRWFSYMNTIYFC